uniref:WD repeat-containing protein 44 n=1 Tax=Cacopsylla melanoneura TaxID=428564 RepID=A0A8D8REL4_9HEMI
MFYVLQTEDYQDTNSSGVRKKAVRVTRFLRSTAKNWTEKVTDKAKNIAHRHKEDVMDLVDEVNPQGEGIKLKASNSHKGPFDFESLQHVQELNSQHIGPVWCMKFSVCGRLLATAGQDRVLRIWVVRSAYSYFQDMRTKYNAEKVSPTPSQESLVSQHSSEDPNASQGCDTPHNDRNPFMPKPFCTYVGHTSDLLDVAWSKNYFVLSSSMDKTVRLWHISRKECLCCFQHIDFVTAICFHPRDDRYFLSGSLDGKLRLWNIPDKKVAVWNEVEGQTKLITAANFCENGKFAVVGSYDGRCIFYNTDQLKYHTQIHVRSTRGKNATGRKISGIEPMPGEDKILVTSNDSRIRLYDLRDLNLSCKYKGYVNVSSQIKASFSHDGKYIVSGSENQCIYIWKTHHDYAKFSSVRRDRNDFWEGIKAHNAVVTCAVFAPCPELIIAQMEPDRAESSGYVLVSADFNGIIKVFLNKTKPKHSSLPVSALA